MANKGLLKHGFKAKAERVAVEYRTKLSIHPCAPLCAFKLAEYLNISIYKATEFLFLPEEMLRLSEEDSGWSALTMITKVNNRIIVNNPYNSEARQQSDVMHELAHIICDHKQSFSQYNFKIPLGMRHFDDVQEEEAKCLGSTLQLPRPGLLWAAKRNYTISQIATHFNSSMEMAAYRMQISGVAKQRFFRNKMEV